MESRQIIKICAVFTIMTVGLGANLQAQPAAADFGIELVFVKGGTFQMGSAEGEADESPVHTVTVNNFFIGKYDITQKQWQNVMGTSPSYFENCGLCPVESVTWNQVQDFIIKLNQITGNDYRLPYEAEWEYAATSGGKNEKWSGTNADLIQFAWYDANADGMTHPVGTKKPNGLGIHDMTGNVWEWCEDYYGAGFYQHSRKENPTGPMNAGQRVVRGGSWTDYEFYEGGNDCRVTNRDGLTPDNLTDDLGFRICLPLE